MARQKLRDIGATYGGLTGKSKADFGRGTAAFVTFMEVINSTRLHGLSLESVKVAKGERQNSVVRGDVLFNGSSETPEEVALSAVVDFDPAPDTYLNSFCFGYRLKRSDVADPTYLAYFFRSSAGRQLVSSLAQGATRYNIAKTKFLNVIVTLPSIDHQREIVDALTDIDDLIATVSRSITKKQAVKQGMMQQLLTGRTRLPGFTQPWREVRLDDVGQFSKGAGLPKSDVVDDGQLPCVHYGELFTHYGAEIHEVTSRTNCSNFPVRSARMDVLMPTSDVTPRGLAKASAITRSDVILGGDILVIRPNRLYIYGPFLAHSIRGDANQVLQLVRGSTVFHLYARDMKNFTLRVPGTKEQEAICAVLRDVQADIEFLKRRHDKAKAVKQGMMQELLAGRTRLSGEEGPA